MRAYIEINGNALENNYLSIKKETSKDVIAVIKSNAYGHGLIECARILAKNKVPMFAVATIEEAIAIRKSLIFTPILLLGPCLDYRILSSYKITALILGETYLQKLLKSPYPIQVHIMLDLGMSREGIALDQLDNVIERIHKSKLQLKGICTHYSSLANYEIVHETFHQLQTKYASMHLVFHSSATSTYLSNHDDNQFFRIGLALYGLDEKHTPVLSLKAPILRKKFVQQGEKVGYDEMGVVAEDGYIYTIGLGYADGWPRDYPTSAYLGDIQLQQIGRTCMDYLMLFSKENIDESSILTIIGEKKTVQMIAREQNTIPYEVTTRFSMRLKRKTIYIK